MRQPEVKTWGGVVTAAMVIALAVYMGTGECSHFPYSRVLRPSSPGDSPALSMADPSVGIGLNLSCLGPPPAQMRETCSSIHSAALIGASEVPGTNLSIRGWRGAMEIDRPGPALREWTV